MDSQTSRTAGTPEPAEPAATPARDQTTAAAAAAGDTPRRDCVWDRLLERATGKCAEQAAELLRQERLEDVRRMHLRMQQLEQEEQQQAQQHTQYGRGEEPESAVTFGPAGMAVFAPALGVLPTAATSGFPASASAAASAGMRAATDATASAAGVTLSAVVSAESTQARDKVAAAAARSRHAAQAAAAADVAAMTRHTVLAAARETLAADRTPGERELPGLRALLAADSAESLPRPFAGGGGAVTQGPACALPRPPHAPAVAPDDDGGSECGSDGGDGGGAALQCQWAAPGRAVCGAAFGSADALHAHVSESHIGRKILHNLCLVCHWAGCSMGRRPFQKRDHIFSHMRKHLPLRSFVCSVCNKTYRWIQDFNKHHARTGHGTGIHNYLSNSQLSDISLDGDLFAVLSGGDSSFSTTAFPASIPEPALTWPNFDGLSRSNATGDDGTLSGGKKHDAHLSSSLPGSESLASSATSDVPPLLGSPDFDISSLGSSTSPASLLAVPAAPGSLDSSPISSDHMRFGSPLQASVSLAVAQQSTPNSTSALHLDDIAVLLMNALLNATTSSTDPAFSHLSLTPP
ncbi:hypothetical protein HK105_200066 [Polyrhizophydium stewartii]|uniref:C2H2-type domain-containing protein n=1 Tax=Polyrhizophydium stewartii TaxID=2732419 RepID=A0ABR4NKF0_9FUNG